MTLPGEATRNPATFDRQVARIRRSGVLAGAVVLVTATESPSASVAVTLKLVDEPTGSVWGPGTVRTGAWLPGANSTKFQRWVLVAVGVLVLSISLFQIGHALHRWLG